jgi:SAM-dependent methyltransferase
VRRGASPGAGWFSIRACRQVAHLIDFVDEALPFADAEFDLVICALALCHVANLRGAVREFARVLRPGGSVLISDFHPDCVGQGWCAALFNPGEALLFTYPGHTRGDYLNALSDAGLQITRTVDAMMGEAPIGAMLDEERDHKQDGATAYATSNLKVRSSQKYLLCTKLLES